MIRERGSFQQLPEQPIEGQGSGVRCNPMGNQDSDPEWYLRLLTPETLESLLQAMANRVK